MDKQRTAQLKEQWNNKKKEKRKWRKEKKKAKKQARKGRRPSPREPPMNCADRGKGGVEEVERGGRALREAIQSYNALLDSEPGSSWVTAAAHTSEESTR